VYAQQPTTVPGPEIVGRGWEPELELIDGIGKKSAQQLAEVGVRTVPQLLEQAHTLRGRQELSRMTGISTARLEAWVRFGDLMRLHGVSPEHARLLRDAGVKSVADLAGLDPEAVYDQIRAVFDPEQHQLRRIPRPELVRAWVNEARQLPPLPLD
jgi:predicted flap endonuclease-1-like 5' DNA nuclease